LKISRASFHLKKQSFQSPLTKVSVLSKAAYTAGNYRGWSDYELTALSRGKHFAKKPNLNFCLTTRASRAGEAPDRDRSNKSSPVVLSRGAAAMYIHIYTYPPERMAIPVSGSVDGGERRKNYTGEQKWRDLRKKLSRIKGVLGYGPRVRSVSRSGDYTFAPIIYQPIMASDLSSPGQWESPLKSSRTNRRQASTRIALFFSSPFFYFIEKLSLDFSEWAEPDCRA